MTIYDWVNRFLPQNKQQQEDSNTIRWCNCKQKINNWEYVKNKNNMERQSAEIMEIEVCIQNSQFQSQSATFA